ncbi:Glycosylated lysosomal membrane protein [Chionoecetes opilio]|uniref:Glycosylated lysosomal membrane protein n=1 Tax=Chionoecetes opilio TaxID=41210 RepID=A0A8J4XQN2_CHIOP|nr:Glycosylated lysosomal membrane protein [Chionoecetes opilio]
MPAATRSLLTVPEINPGCEHCVGPTVVVTAGVAANNTLHHLWGTKGALSFLVVAGTGGPDVTVDWEALHNNTPGSITFQKDPSHAFGFVIPSLVLYNDLKDNGAFQGQNESLRVPMADFQWSARVLPGSPHQVAVEMETTHFQGMPLPNHTRILMKVSAYGQDGRSTVLPHLLRTPDSAQLDLILDNLNLNLTQETQEWNKKRWGMDVVMFSSENKAKEEDEDDFGIKFHTQKSLDDEHTPGVFNVKEEPLYVTRAHDTQEMREGGAGLEDTDMRSQEEDVMWTTNYGNQGNYGRNWNRGRRVKGMVDQGNSGDSDMKEYEKYKETNETESQPQQSQEYESEDDDDTNGEDNGKEVTARVDEPERKTTAPKCQRFHSHHVVLCSQLLTLNVATCDLPTLLAAAGVHPSRQHAVIRLTCAFLRKTDSLKASLAYAVLGKNLTLPGAAVASVISFGQPKDGFYQSENYTTWTVAMGEGAAPLESFSTLIVVVISLGVVLPAAMLLVGCVVLAVRRYRRHADEE